jgi:hypothetical protein
VSAAYYAIFHLLVKEGAEVLAPRQPTGLRTQVRRAFTHADMKSVCKQFAQGNVAALSSGTQNLINPPLDAQLVSVAATFVALQDERHRADYDAATPFDRVDALQKIDLAQQAFDDWTAVRDSPNAKVFLAALLLQRHWNK